MAFKRSYSNMEEIPEALRDHYVERDGAWLLDLEGGDPFSVPKDQHDRVYRQREDERKAREAAQKQLDAIKERFGDISESRLDEIMGLLEGSDNAEHDRLIAEKRFEEAAEKKVARRIADMQREMEQFKQQVQSADDRYKKLLDHTREVKINASLQSALLSAGADASKIKWLVKAEAENWELDPETYETTPYEWNSDRSEKLTVMGKDGKPLTMNEQAATILRDNPWLLPDSNGSRSAHQGRQQSAPGAYRFDADQMNNNPEATRAYRRALEQSQKTGIPVEIVSNQ